MGGMCMFNVLIYYHFMKIMNSTIVYFILQIEEIKKQKLLLSHSVKNKTLTNVIYSFL